MADWRGCGQESAEKETLPVRLRSDFHDRFTDFERGQALFVCGYSSSTQDILQYSYLIKSLRQWEPSDSRNDGGGWHTAAAEPASARLMLMMLSGGQKQQTGAEGKAMRTIREDLPYEGRLRELGLFRLEKAQGRPYYHGPVHQGWLPRRQKLPFYKESHRRDMG